MAFNQFNQVVTGERRAAGSYVSGVWVEGAVAALSIGASVQPASQNELKLLPQGRIEAGAYSLRSKTEILEGDIFVIGGERHEVIRRQIWQNGVLPHYLGIAVREIKTP